MGLSNVHRTPTPESPSISLTRELQIANPDPWIGLTDAQTNDDPDYLTGVWSPNDTPENLRVWDQPVEPNDAPTFTAANLDLPEVITIYNTDDKPLLQYALLRTCTQVLCA